MSLNNCVQFIEGSIPLPKAPDLSAANRYLASLGICGAPAVVWWLSSHGHVMSFCFAHRSCADAKDGIRLPSMDEAIVAEVMGS